MYQPSRQISSFNIAGFQYHDGPSVFFKLTVGTMLRLVPEPDNPHDPEAIAIYFEDTMIGYVPSSENSLLALLAFYGHEGIFECQVLKADSTAEPWEQVRVRVNVVDARK